MTSRTRYSIVAGLAVVLATGGVVAYFSADSRAREKAAPKGPAAVPVSVAIAARQNAPVRLQAIGNVEAYTTVAVKARVDGQIIEVLFQEGKEVKKGEVLFRIDPRPFEAALKQAEAQRAARRRERDQAHSQERRYQELLDKNSSPRTPTRSSDQRGHRGGHVRRRARRRWRTPASIWITTIDPLADRRLRRQARCCRPATW